MQKVTELQHPEVTPMQKVTELHALETMALLRAGIIQRYLEFMVHTRRGKTLMQKGGQHTRKGAIQLHLGNHPMQREQIQKRMEAALMRKGAVQLHLDHTPMLKGGLPLRLDSILTQKGAAQLHQEAVPTQLAFIL